jgi:NADPH2:quinone reductase
MKALVCREYAPYDKLVLDDIEPPAMRAGGVRIRVRATGLAFATSLVVAGKHQNKPDLPFVPGTEVAGEVIDCADDVTGLKPGDRVTAGVRSGGFAEQVMAESHAVYPIPDAMDYAGATQFPTIYGTAYGSLIWRAGLSDGEVLLVHAAAGASGLAALEIGHAVGAKVIATASGDDKLAVAAAHGADHVINYRTDNFRERVLELTGGRGADVIFDPVGGDVFDQSLRCIAPEGRILPIGFAGGRIPLAPTNILLVKNITVIGLYWGYYLGWGRVAAKPAEIARVPEAMAKMFDWYGQGLLRPVTHAELTIEDFRQGFEALLSRQVIGKIVLTL